VLGRGAVGAGGGGPGARPPPHKVNETQ
jgi:hypothetical protein